MQTVSKTTETIKRLLSEGKQTRVPTRRSLLTEAGQRMYIEFKDTPDWVQGVLRNHQMKPSSIGVEVGNKQTIGGSWHEANRTTVYLYQNGQVKSLSGHYGQGMNATKQERSVNRGIEVDLKPGQMALTVNSYPKSATIHVAPMDVAKLIPSGEGAGELPIAEKIVLVATQGLKPFARKEEARRYVMISDAQWDAAVQGLISKGFLSKSKGITAQGRNAVTSLGRELMGLDYLIKKEYPNLMGIVSGLGGDYRIDVDTGKLVIASKYTYHQFLAAVAHAAVSGIDTKSQDKVAANLKGTPLDYLGNSLKEMPGYVYSQVLSMFGKLGEKDKEVLLARHIKR